MPRGLVGLIAAVDPDASRLAARAADEDGVYGNQLILSHEGGCGCACCL